MTTPDGGGPTVPDHRAAPSRPPVPRPPDPGLDAGPFDLRGPFEERDLAAAVPADAPFDVPPDPSYDTPYDADPYDAPYAEPYAEPYETPRGTPRDSSPYDTTRADVPRRGANRGPGNGPAPGGPGHPAGGLAERGASFGRTVAQSVGRVRGQAAGAAAALRARRAETPSASQRRSAGTAPGAAQALPLAVGMFTVLPVPPVQDTVDGTLGGRALRLLPAIGAALGLLGWLAALLFWRGHGAGSPLLGGVLWVAVLALLTRGLHLDGLADVADALGSRRPPAEALMIMRRSDIGPFGVAAVVGVLLIQIAAVVTVLGSASRAQGLVVLVAAAVTGRLAALDAARPAIPPARSGGFGALVAGTATTGVRAVSIGVTLLVATVALAVTSTSVAASLWLPVAVLVGLGAGRVVTAQAERRFGGSTGDVFGAVIELATAAMLLVVAGAVAWGWLP